MDKNLDFPHNLLKDIFKDGYVYAEPDDLGASVLYILATALHSQDAKAIISRYMYGMTYEAIAKGSDTTRQAVHASIARCINTLRADEYAPYFIFGVKALTEQKAEDAGRLVKKQFGDEICRLIKQEAGPEPALDPTLAEMLAKKACDLKLENTSMSDRTVNCFKRQGKDTLGDLVLMDFNGFARMRNFGKKSYDEAMAVLKRFSLHLPSMDPPASHPWARHNT